MIAYLYAEYTSYSFKNIFVYNKIVVIYILNGQVSGNIT